jgi:hypothetical protein
MMKILVPRSIVRHIGTSKLCQNKDINKAVAKGPIVMKTAGLQSAELCGQIEHDRVTDEIT